MRKLFFLFLAAAAGTGLFFHFKPMEKGLSLEGEKHLVPAASIKFLSDETYLDGGEKRVAKQEIFAEVLKMIDGAENYVLVDMFLFNDFAGKETEIRRELSEELSGALADKKKENPTASVVVITDPINSAYGGPEPEHFKKMREAGVEVVITDLNKVRDGNPAYSSFYRLLSFIPWPDKPAKNRFPNPFDYDKPKVPLKSYLYLPNFKANHRKLIVADKKVAGGYKMVSLITSANPHDASGYHGNSALTVEDGVWKDIIKSETAVAKFSGKSISLPAEKISDASGEVEAQILTEEKVRKKLLDILAETVAGDKVDMAMFYLADRKIIKALLAASAKGAEIRLLLDPNKDAFGFKKNGVPNRPAAAELIKKSKGKIKIRWCDTNGEQCHSKMVLVKNKNGYHLMLGSANLTRRNIGDYNLETEALVKSDSLIPAVADAYDYFNRAWNNEGGKTYSADYDKYKNESSVSYFIYMAREISGMSSF